jgi:hypothetical protein
LEICLFTACGLYATLAAKFQVALFFMQDPGKSWILRESAVFICKALQAEAIVNYASA